VREHLGSEHIDTVFVRADWDADGDEILRVTLVIKPSRRQISRQKLVGLISHIRDRLEQQEVKHFPVLSFVSKKEASKYTCRRTRFARRSHAPWNLAQS
jgi:hypothetical protein